MPFIVIELQKLIKKSVLYPCLVQQSTQSESVAATGGKYQSYSRQYYSLCKH